MAVTPGEERCGWVVSCDAPARHLVERQTRPGLILREAVCDEHVHVARRRGYLLRATLDRPKDNRRAAAG
jgi:hypothetical protein